ncbi:hypothetical protein NQ314_018731 [Rhamnusium bicolor]|uniref:Uncharacterized protein n=1 Tax=Rhamnusium bicolor TaxID=1586634 RepID=A0AAV8WQC9_9CUCU|nr:hypothetical protein NQ314_018731 [Rhamnusium bicolor]
MTQNSLDVQILDYVLTNFDNVHVSIHDIPKITDHSVISVNLFSGKIGTYMEIIKSFRILNELNIHKINLELISSQFLLCCTDVNVLYDNLLVTCQYIVDDIAPIKTYSVKSNCLPWYDCEVKSRCRERVLNYQIFDYNKNEINWQNYKKLRNEVVNLLKQKKQQYCYNKIDICKNYPIKMWKTLKTLINNKNNTSDFNNGIQFDINGEIRTIKIDINIAEQFNEYFIDSIKDIINTIDTGAEWNNNNDVLTSFSEFRKIDLKESGTIVNSLDGTCSVHETLNGKFLKEIFGVIGHILFNFLIHLCKQEYFQMI